MPHSGGGGDSDSGAHSGSESGGSRSGGGGSSYAGVRRWNTGYRETCRNKDEDVWVCYDGDEPRFRYVEKKAYRKFTRAHNLKVTFIPALLVPVAATVAITLTSGVAFFPISKGKPDYVTQPIEGETWDMIEDNAGCYTEEEKKDIVSAIDTLYLTSGIETQVVTITEEMFYQADRIDLETLAYSEYVDRFPDEDHFLILFEDKGNESWAFEIMEGDNTSEWLTEDVSYSFDQLFTENLWATSQFTYGTALSSALTDTTLYLQEHAGEPTERDREKSRFLRYLYIVMTVISLTMASSFYVGRQAYGTIEKRMARDGYEKVSNAKIVTDANGRAAPEMVSCEYCGGTYPSGMLTCPHCGAPAREKRRKAY
jgi:hypothetical protein